MRKRTRPTPAGLAFLAACVPPVIYGVMGAARFLGASGGPDWTGLGLGAAMVLLTLGALAAYRRRCTASALILLFAAYAPLVLALFVMIAVR